MNEHQLRLWRRHMQKAEDYFGSAAAARTNGQRSSYMDDAEAAAHHYKCARDLMALCDDIEATERKTVSDNSLMMFGLSPSQMAETYATWMEGGHVIAGRFGSHYTRFATSILSDAQEEMERGNHEHARKLINRAKYVLDHGYTSEREHRKRCA